MEEQKIFFASNLKFLRERKRLSQEALAGKLHISRVKLNALENGHTRSPQPEDYIRSSEYFRISVDSLLKVDLSGLSEWRLRELEAGNDVYITGTRIRVLAITVDKGNKENVEYVPVKAKAGYRSGYNDPEFIASLPKYSLPNLPRSGTFRIFPTVGDSMLPIPEGAEVTGRFVPDWSSLKPGTPCIVILKGEQDFVFKLVTLQQDSRTLLLQSLNRSYLPYSVGVDEVLELWELESYRSKIIPESATDMDELKQMIRELRWELKSC